MEAVDLNKTRDFYNPGDGNYVYDCINRDGAYFEVRRVRRDQYGQLWGSLDVRTPKLAGARLLDELGTILRFDSINLSDVSKRRSAASDLHTRAQTKDGDINWLLLLDELAFKVGTKESRGEPGVWLDEVQLPPGDRTYTVDGFPLFRDLPQIGFGEGGSMKSMLALYWAGCLAKQGVNVMYADWELTEEVHKERLTELFGAGREPRMRYLECNRPLVHEIDRLAAEKHEHQIQFAFFDSIAFACHGKPEDAVVAQEYLRAAKSLGVGTFHTAHNAGAAEHKEYRPFGSVFWHNGVRATWFMKAEVEDVQDANKRTRTIALINRKHLRGLRASLAYRLEFEPGMTRVSRTDPINVACAVKSLSTSERVKAVVSTGPKTFAEIVEALPDVKENTIRKTVTRSTKTFKVLEGANGAQRVALLELRRVS